MRHNVRAYLLVMAALAGPGASGPAFAQQAAAPAGQASVLEEIVVTARRREEALQSVPVAVTAFTAETIREHKIETGEDLQHFVPSLYINSGTGLRTLQTFTLRGQGNGGVVTYFSQVPLSNGGLPGFYYDLENLQVLNGPQGTLFGRNTTGGAILFEPKRPTNKLEAYGQMTLGGYDWHEFEGMVNVPVVDDRVMVRLAMQRKQRDGYTTDIGTRFPGRTYDADDYWAFRAGVTLKLGDRLENYTVVDSYYSHTTGGGVKMIASNIAGSNLRFYPTYAALAAQQAAGGPRTTMMDGDQLDKMNNLGVTNITRYEITDALTFQNIFGMRQTRYLRRWDLDGMAVPVLNEFTTEGWSSQLRAYSDEPQLQMKLLGGKLDMVVGAFWTVSTPFSTNETSAVTLGGINPATPTHQYSAASFGARAVFGQGTLDLGALAEGLDGIKLTGGVRYNRDYGSSKAGNAVIATGVCTNNPGRFFPNCVGEAGASFSATTWTAGIDYQITPQVLLYAASRRGYRQGGFNGNAPTPETRKYNPEYVQDYEVGIKADWQVGDLQGRTNLAAYHSDYTNIQRSILVPPATPGAPPANITENAAKAKIQGVEFQAILKPTEQVDLQASWSYTHSKYLAYFSPIEGDLSGFAFPNTPLNKINLTGRYHIPIEPTLGSDLSAAVTWTHQSHVKQLTQTATTYLPLATQPAYSLLDLRLDWRDVGGHPLDLSAFVTNVTNKTYRTGTLDLLTSLGYITGLYNQPRMWGFQIRYRYDG